MSDKPQRIQLRRTKGWRMPPNTVKVSRPGKWGNRYTPGPAIITDHCTVPALTIEDCVRLYREHLERQLTHTSIRAELAKLRGKHLACWCAPGTPCHADVLLELANA